MTERRHPVFQGGQPSAAAILKKPPPTSYPVLNTGFGKLTRTFDTGTSAPIRTWIKKAVTSLYNNNFIVMIIFY